jgi:WD40 repeat protein
MSGKESTAQKVKDLDLAWLLDCGDYISHLSWSKDGSLLACGDAEGKVTVVDTSGKVVSQWMAHNLGTLKVGWSASGKYLASAGQDCKARIYETANRTFEQVAEMDHGSSWVEHLAWNAKRDVLLTAAGKDLRLWDAVGNVEKEFARHSSTIAGIAWNPAMPNLFATSSYGGLRLWADSEAKPKRFFEWKGSVLDIAYSPNGKTVAGGCQDGAAHIWLLPSGDDLFMNGYATKVRELAWDSTSRYLATGGSEVVVIWDFSGKGPSGSKPLMLEGHQAFISNLAFAPSDMRLASSGLDGNLIIWNIAGKSKSEPLALFTGDSEISSIAWQPQAASIAIGCASGKLILLDLKNV